ncbi:C40 family peptidase [Streptomyces monticola]|uniref:C40 family peptidase n=1 Tax=Streptomyces monticola TaxID=2666263 RepID=A0ABW2JN04_9ACTN
MQVALVRSINHSHTYVAEVRRIANRYSAALSTTGAAAKAVAFARSQLGTPYVWGGDGPSEGGFDCSGLTQAAYRAAGITIPRVAQPQFDHGPRVPRGSQIQPGDLLFFGSGPNRITHVGIYSGDGRMIDAPRPGTVIRERAVRLAARNDFQGATRPAARGGPR